MYFLEMYGNYLKSLEEAVLRLSGGLSHPRLAGNPLPKSDAVALPQPPSVNGPFYNILKMAQCEWQAVTAALTHLSTFSSFLLLFVLFN